MGRGAGSDRDIAGPELTPGWLDKWPSKAVLNGSVFLAATVSRQLVARLG